MLGVGTPEQDRVEQINFVCRSSVNGEAMSCPSAILRSLTFSEKKSLAGLVAVSVCCLVGNCLTDGVHLTQRSPLDPSADFQRNTAPSYPFPFAAYVVHCSRDVAGGGTHVVTVYPGRQAIQ